MRLPGRYRNAPIALRATLAALALFPSAGRGQTLPPPAEYLPAGHPAWRDLESLWNRGGLPGLALFTRPLARADIARAVDAGLAARPDLAALPPARRLLREFARELGPGAARGFRETPPREEWREGGVRLRIQGEARGRFTLEGGRTRTVPGTIASAVVRAYLPGGAFVLADVGVERIVDESPLGDPLVKGSDWFLSTRASYGSVRTDAVDLVAGLWRERWGPGSSGTLLLSEAALPYPALFYTRAFGRRARFSALTGALHQPGGRWFSAHRLEIGLAGGRLRLGFHESAAYRSAGLDLLYVTGVVPYTLVQRFHDRTTPEGESVAGHRNNVMAGFDFAWRCGRGIRIDGEILIDDLATETSRQPHRLGFQGGLSWSGSLAGGSADARAEFVKVYRYTYAVFYGADFLQDGVPLGFAGGPDVEHAELWVERDLGLDLRAGAGVDLTRKGEGAAGEAWDPGEPLSQNAGARLSGTVERRLFPHLRLEVLARDVLRARARLGVLRITNARHVSGEKETSLRAEAEALVQW